VTLVNILRPVMWTSVNFWMEVPSLSLVINKVPYVIRKETQGTKSKAFKPQGGQRYLPKI